MNWEDTKKWIILKLQLVDGNELDEFDKALAIAMMNYGVPAHVVLIHYAAYVL